MKNFFQLIKVLWSSSRGRAFLFFGFYFVFFFFLILIIRGGHHPVDTDQTYERGKKYSFSFQELFDKNYSFSYSEVLDGNSMLYEGKKNQKQSLFHYMENQYYYDGENYYLKEEKWQKSDNPFLLPDFFNEEMISSLVDASSYESTTSYESGREVYHFYLSSNTINQIVYGIHTDIMEEPNKVVVSVNENHQIDSISFYLNSYCIASKMCQKSLDIKLSFSDYGKIDKIESPIARQKS